MDYRGKTPRPAALDYATVVHRDGSEEHLGCQVLEESDLKVYVDGALLLCIACTASDLEELVVGRLLTEGYISSMRDIAELSIDRGGAEAHVRLRSDIASGEKAECLQLESSGYAHRAPGSSALREFGAVREGWPRWSAEEVFVLCDRFFGDSPLHATTSGTHSCYMSIDNEVVYSGEDIGRHNALDKAIGFALMRGLPLERAVVFISGRIPTDMMSKIVRAGIPLVATKAMPTRQAIDLARKYKVVLVGKAKRDELMVFSDADSALCVDLGKTLQGAA